MNSMDPKRSGMLSALVLVLLGGALSGSGLAADFEIFEGGSSLKVPLVAFNSARGEYFVAWLEADSNAYRLKGRRVIPGGGEVSLGKIRDIGKRSLPEALAYNPRRREYVLLTAEDAFRSNRPLTARRLRRNGEPRGVPLKIGGDLRRCGEVASADLLYIATTKRWLVVWTEEACGLKGRLLKGKNLEADGPEIEFGVPTPFESFAEFGQVSLAHSSTTNEILLVYVDADLEKVIARRLSVFGETLGETVVFSPERVPRFLLNPVVIDLPTRDRWLVTWGVDSRVNGRFVYRDGSVGETFRIANGAFFAAAAYNSFAYRFLVYWEDRNYIKGRWFLPSGTPKSRRFRIGGLDTGQPVSDTDNLVACSDRARHCLVVFEKQVINNSRATVNVQGELLRAR